MNFKVIQQGKPAVNTAPPHVTAQGENFIAFEIDMRSKWCEVDSICSDSDGMISVCIGTTDRSCNLNDSRECPWTEIQFPDHNCNEWDIFTAQCSRYTLRVVLIKR